jgi:hypothetical protein
MHFCPICTRKIQNCLGFDLKKHYQNILSFLVENFPNYEKEATWYKNRIELL